MGIYVFITITALIIHIVFSVKFGKIAEERGHDAFTYGYICFFLGVIGYCWVATLPDLQMQQTLHSLTHRLNQLEDQLSKEQTATSSAVSSQPLNNPKPAPAKDALIPTVSADGEIICPICNIQQKRDRKVCWSCGQKFITK